MANYRESPAMSFQRFDRLLFLIRPPAPVAVYMDEQRRFLGAGKRVRTDYLHITLCKVDFPFLPPTAIQLMREIGDSILASAFWVGMDRVTGGPKSILFRPSERIKALFELQARLAAGIARADRLPRDPERFSPHITLLYRRGQGFDWEIDGISWLAEEFLLVHSKVGAGEHVVLDRWVLPVAPSAQGRQRPVDRLLPMALQKRIGLGEMPAAEETRMRG